MQDTHISLAHGNQQTGYGIHLLQSEISIRNSVQTVCYIVGFDPLFLACEGRVVAITAINRDRRKCPYYW